MKKTSSTNEQRAKRSPHSLGKSAKTKGVAALGPALKSKKKSRLADPKRPNSLASGARRDKAIVLGLKPRQDNQERALIVDAMIERITPWAGSTKQARAWFESEPIPAFGGLTAAALVGKGEAKAVVLYIDHIARGGFA